MVNSFCGVWTKSKHLVVVIKLSYTKLCVGALIEFGTVSSYNPLKGLEIPTRNQIIVSCRLLFRPGTELEYIRYLM